MPAKKPRKTHMSKKDRQRRRELVLQIRMRGVLDREDIASRLLVLSKGEFDITGRTVSNDLKAIMEDMGSLPAGVYRQIQIKRYEARLLALDKMFNHPDPAQRLKANREYVRIMRRLDKISGAENHVRRIEAKLEASVQGGLDTDALVRLGRKYEQAADASAD